MHVAYALLSPDIGGVWKPKTWNSAILIILLPCTAFHSGSGMVNPLPLLVLMGRQIHIVPPFKRLPDSHFRTGAYRGFSFDKRNSAESAPDCRHGHPGPGWPAVYINCLWWCCLRAFEPGPAHGRSTIIINRRKIEADGPTAEIFQDEKLLMQNDSCLEVKICLCSQNSIVSCNVVRTQHCGSLFYFISDSHSHHIKILVYWLMDCSFSNRFGYEIIFIFSTKVQLNLIVQLFKH